MNYYGDLSYASIRSKLRGIAQKCLFWGQRMQVFQNKGYYLAGIDAPSECEITELCSPCYLLRLNQVYASKMTCEIKEIWSILIRSKVRFATSSVQYRHLTFTYRQLSEELPSTTYIIPYRMSPCRSSLLKPWKYGQLKKRDSKFKRLL